MLGNKSKSTKYKQNVICNAVLYRTIAKFVQKMEGLKCKFNSLTEITFNLTATAAANNLRWGHGLLKIEDGQTFYLTAQKLDG